MGTLKSRFLVNKLLATCVKKAKWAKAIRVLGEMKELHIEPGTVAVNTAMRACEQGSMWQQALHIFHEASPGSPLDVVSFSTAINACGRGSRWADALHLLELQDLEACGHKSNHEELPGFRGQQVDMVMWNSAISACEKAAAWTWAMHLLRSACHPITPDVVTYNSTISSLSRVRRWNDALQLCSELERREISPAP